MEFTDIFFHEHTLLLTDDEESSPRCNACLEKISGSFYSCHGCNFNIHKSCVELPREFQNPYHPHPLTLLAGGREDRGVLECFACRRYLMGFSFHCGECELDLDIKCALWKLTADEGQDQLHHSSHLHPLVAIEKKKQQQRDEDDDDVYCKMCKEHCSDDAPAYACDPCKFYLHRSCAALQLPPTLQHVNHPCLRTLCLKIQCVNCDVCGHWAEFYSYLCKKCDFWVEMSCALLTIRSPRQFLHFSHGHPLQLISTHSGLVCNIHHCFQDKLKENFVGDTAFVPVFRTDQETEMEFTDIFFHEHTLLLTDDEESSPRCNACLEEISGSFYSCHGCNFNIHKSCVELPREFQNPYHPHPLTLLAGGREDRGFLECFACRRYLMGFSFHCGECELDLDIKCALWKLTADEGQDQLHHSSHLHPLVAIEKKKQQQRDEDDDDVYCKMCKEHCSDDAPAYACDPCNFYLHRSCAALQLPPTLQHVNHPCLLTLCLKIQCVNCDVCGHWAEFYSYLCKKCDFWVEMSCALLTIRSPRQFLHFSHGHPLEPTEIIKHDDGILCAGCAKHCSGQTYVCCIRECTFFLHDSCFSLPRKIRHPFHPFHPLTLHLLIETSNQMEECKVCYRFCYGLAYSCRRCKLYIHAECPVVISSINYQGHPHNILLVDGLDPLQTLADDGPTPDKGKTVLLCSVCGTTCEYSIAMFHCIECSFHLHFECGPLPCFIKHEDHKYCSLQLTDSPVTTKTGDGDNYDVLYCDTCEKIRDPRLPVYHCSDRCAYIAEIKCVILEVLRSLRGEYGEVELRSAIFRHQTGKVICKGTVKGIELAPDQEGVGGDIDTKEGGQVSIFHRMIQDVMDFDMVVNSDQLTTEMVFSYYDEDYVEFKTLLGRISILNHESLEHFLENYNAGNIENRKNYFWKNDLEFSDAFGTFITPVSAAFWANVTRDLDRKLDYFRKYESVISRNFLNFVYVGGLSLVSELAIIFEDLCSKYGDIVPKSAYLSPWKTNFLISSLCETIRGMCTTRVADISEKKLISWWRCLSALESKGFIVKFAFDRLKRVVDAYYALQTQKTVKEDDERINRRIGEISEQIKILEAEQTALKEERCKRTSKPASSTQVTKCFEEASVLKWTTAGEGLL